MKDLGYFIIGAIIFLAFMYGMYWVVKNISYFIFYEDMVIETVKQMKLDGLI